MEGYSTDSTPEVWTMTRVEAIRELQKELEKPILPPSDWKEQALSRLNRARKLLRESPMGRGTL